MSNRGNSGLTAERFAEYFKAVHGHEPFPWQDDLLRRVADTGRWPALLDLPTGSGKTAALDVAVYHLAMQAGSTGPRMAPFRTVLVVDRRTVVDQAHRRAEKIRRALTYPLAPAILREVSSALAGLSSEGEPLQVALLRGGIVRDDSWVRCPDQPLIAVSTVDQVGSRLLFRGYGVSNSMLPVHAGLLGNDTLFLLDEVHLSQPFLETLTALEEKYRGWAERPIASPWQVVRMSATTTAHTGSLTLSQRDREHAVLRRRLEARKPTTLVQCGKKGAAAALPATATELALEQAEPGRTVAVVVNRVRTAVQIADRIRTEAPESLDVLLVTGRMRPLDRESLDAQLSERVSAGRSRDETSRPAIVVSTQCIEAGADFDFDVLITECAALDALRQRFGRLNRLGEIDNARGYVLLASDLSVEDPIYGASLAATWRWLEKIKHLDFGIGALAMPGEDALAELVSRRPSSPTLLPAYVDTWAQTAPMPWPTPDISLWLHGPSDAEPEVQIVWRADITEEDLNGADSERSLADILERLEVCRPSTLEALSVPISAARRWLMRQEAGEGFGDVEGEAAREEDLDDREADPRGALVWKGDDSRIVSPFDLLGTRGSSAIHPGDLLVVPCSYGGLHPHWLSWHPKSKETVRDLGDRAAWRRSGGLPVLRLAPSVLANELGATCERLEEWKLTPPDPETMAERPDLEETDELTGFLDRLTARITPDQEEQRPDEAAGQPHEDAPSLGNGSDTEEIPPRLGDPRALEWLRMSADHFKNELLSSRPPRIFRIGAPIESAGAASGPEANAKRPGSYSLVSRRRLPAVLLAQLGHHGEAVHGTATELPHANEASTDGDGGSFNGATVTLGSHLRGVANIAAGFANRVGLPAELASDLEMAARFHDVGKADPRFQVWIHGGSDFRARTSPEPLAKSAQPGRRSDREKARRRAGYPAGYRHEILSSRMVDQAPSLPLREAHDRDLVLHLIASHHGWCRPLAPAAVDDAPIEVTYVIDRVVLTASSRHGLERLDSGVSERFWRLVRRYGWWGLAWMETIVRLADHRRSELERNQEEGRS